MGFFGAFNKYWTNFFLETGRRPNKTDIETWRAENPSWRPEITLDEIVQHSKGRRDPEKNRQYFVEYRRKLRGSAKRPAPKRGGGRRAGFKRPEADEPWEEATSDEEPRHQQEEDETEEETCDEAAQTSSARRKQRQQRRRLRNAKLQEQDDDHATGPGSSTKVKAEAAATHMQLHDAGTADQSAAASTAANDDADRDAAATCGPQFFFEGTLAPQPMSTALPASPAASPSSAGDANAVPVPVRIPVRRARGPMAAKLLIRSAAAPQPLSCGDAWGRRGGSATGYLCAPGEGRPSHCDSGVPAAAATAANVALNDENACARETHSAAAVASASAPGFDAPPMASWAAVRHRPPGTLANGGEASVPQQLAAVFSGAAGLWNSGHLGSKGGCLNMPCWIAGSAWCGAAAAWMPGIGPSAEGAPSCAQLQAAHLQVAPLPLGPVSVGLPVNVVASSEGAAAGSPTVDASTKPFYDAELHRTCSTGSINTGRNAEVTGLAAPAGNDAQVAPAAAAAVMPRTATAAKRACPLPLARTSVGDLSSCAPNSDGSPSASVAGASQSLQDEPAQISSKRQRTGDAPAQLLLQLAREEALQGLPATSQLGTPTQAVSKGAVPSALCRPAGHLDGSHALLNCAAPDGANWACVWPSSYPGGFFAVPATGVGVGGNAPACLPDPTSASGCPALHLRADVDASATMPYAVPAPELGPVHHVAGAASGNLLLGQQQHPLPFGQVDLPGGVLAPEAEADTLDSKWLDNLLAHSDMEFVLGDLSPAQQHGLAEGPDGALSLPDLEGAGDVAAWSAAVEQGLWGIPPSDAVCFDGPA